MSKFSGYEDKPFIAELYDYVPFYTNRPDLDFYLDFAGLTAGSVLELGCGTGRILIPTAAAGYEITGLDFSDHMLARCRQKLEDQAPEVQNRTRLVKGHMAGFDLAETFSLVTGPFRVFAASCSRSEAHGRKNPLFLRWRHHFLLNENGHEIDQIQTCRPFPYGY